MLCAVKQYKDFAANPKFCIVKAVTPFFEVLTFLFMDSQVMCNFFATSPLKEVVFLKSYIVKLKIKT